MALTSDRGLCGGVHSSICKTIRNELKEKPSLENVGILCVGDKSRAQLARYLHMLGLNLKTNLSSQCF